MASQVPRLPWLRSMACAHGGPHSSGKRPASAHHGVAWFQLHSLFERLLTDATVTLKSKPRRIRSESRRRDCRRDRTRARSSSFDGPSRRSASALARALLGPRSECRWHAAEPLGRSPAGPVEGRQRAATGRRGPPQQDHQAGPSAMIESRSQMRAGWRGSDCVSLHTVAAKPLPLKHASGSPPRGKTQRARAPARTPAARASDGFSLTARMALPIWVREMRRWVPISRAPATMSSAN